MTTEQTVERQATRLEEDRLGLLHGDRLTIAAYDSAVINQRREWVVAAADAVDFPRPGDQVAVRVECQRGMLFGVALELWDKRGTPQHALPQP